MAFKFYIDNVEKNVETNASFRSTQDESLDDGSLVLEWVDSETIIKPRTPVRIDEINDSNNVIHEWNFITLSDNVEPVDKANGFYSHRLTVVQNTHELSHRLLRNSNFQQPVNDISGETIVHGHIFVQHNSSLDQFTSDGVMHLPLASNLTDDYDYRKDKVYIGSKEKLNKVIVELDTWCLCFHFASLGSNQLNVSVNPRPTQVRNAHSSFQIQIEYRETENATVSATTNVNIGLGNRKNEKILVNIPLAFFENNGAGWYSVKINTFPTFNLESSEMVFNHTQEDLISDNLYPLVLANIYLKLKVDTYYYTLYDVLDQIRSQSLKTLNSIDRATSPYTLPNDSELEEIIAPDFQFNGLSVFDAVSQVFNYLDAVPTMSKTGELGYELLNEFNGVELPSDYAFADKKTQIEDKYYDNQIVTQYSNAKQPTSIWYPAKNIYRVPESNVYGIVSSASNYQLVTDKPIEKIESLNIYLYNTYFDFRYKCNFTTNFNGATGVQITTLLYSLYLPNYVIDIASKVYESTIYKTLPVGSVSDFSQDYQQNTLMFIRGSKAIPLGTYEELGYTNNNLPVVCTNKVIKEWAVGSDAFFQLNNQSSYPQYWNFNYNIEYVATFNGQAMIESPENKKEGQFVVAQSGIKTSLNKMGSNMLGFIAKSGNESKAVTMQLTTYDARLTKGSMWIDSNNNKWIANIVKITFTTSEEIITEVEFVKNFNMISQRTQIDEDIKYYMVDQSLSAKGYENVNEYIYFSKSAISKNDTTCFTDTLINSLLKGTFNNDNSQKTIDYCVMHFDSLSSVYVPLHIYGVGNVIAFEFNFEHPTSAGSYIASVGEIKSTPVLYTDEDGFGETMYVLMRSNDEIKLENNYPIHTTPDYNESLIGFNYKYYKRPNEILSFNYGIALLPLNNEEIYFGETFIANNYLISNLTNRRLYMYVSETEKYGINDKKAKGEQVSSQLINVNVNTTERSITFSANSYIDLDGISWCIADENGNIYIAVNQEISLGSGGGYIAKLYYGKSRNRI